MRNHQKGKTSTQNNSFQSTTFSHNFPSNYENPYNSIFFQNSHRDSFDPNQGGANFSGFFSPSNPGNFYSFEQPIVFNAISNINMPKNKVKKKTSPSASFRQYYLDTIKEVYKPRHNKNEKDLIFYEKSKGYLQESLGDKLKLTKLGKSQAVYKKEKNVINSDLESELEDSSKEKKNSLTERAKNSQTTIKMNKEEKISKYFLLPKIPKKKKQVSEKNKTLKIPRTKSFFDKKIIIPTIITRDKSENLHEKSNTNVPLNEDSSYLFQKSTPYSVNPNYGFSNLKSSFDNKMESSVKHKTDISIKQKNNDIKSSTLILHPPFINDNSLSSSTIPKNIIPQKENISNTKVLSDPDNGSISQNFNDPPDNYINKNNDYYNNNNLSPRVLLHKIIPLQDIHANSKSNGFNENSDNINKFSEINNQNYENNFKNPIENNPKFSSSNNVNEKNSDNQDLNNNSNEENSKNSDENKINGQKLINSHIQNEKNLNRFIPNLEEIDNMNLKNDDKLNEINIVRNLENLNLEKTVFITLDKKNEKQMDNETLPDLLEENERKQRISILDNIKEKNFSNQDISNMSKVNLPILDQNISNLDKLDLKILDNIKEKKIPNKNLGVDEAIDINVSNQNSPNLSNLHDDKEKIDNSYNLTFNEQLQSPPELSSPEFIKKPISQNKNNKQNTNISNEINSYFKEEIGQNSKIKKERKASPCIKIKQLSDNSLLKKSEHTSFKLTPQKITSLRRGTNTAGIDNSFSLMKKIFDEQEFKNEQYSIKYEKVLHFKNHSSQKSCDSLTNQSTSTNSLLSQIHLNFNKKNTNYERKTQFKIEKNPQSLTKQSSRNSIFRQSQNFKKKAKRFFTLLANLHLTFRTGSEETNSFMFLDSRYQNEDKPLINLREIFRKKTLEETQNNLFGKIQKPKNKQILMRSGTSGAEKNESVASLTSPITQKSFVENSSNGSLFFINVHPPNLDNEIIFEYSELQEEIKKDETEMDKFKRKIRDFRGSLKEEQTKLMNLQIFNHKKLWKLSLGYLISNYKMLLVTEKEYMAGINFNFSPLIEIFPKTRRSEISLLPKKIIIDYKISIENEYILKKFDYNLDDENLIKSFKRDDELEEESYEEIFNQNSDFMEDNKNCDNEYIFKFLYHNNKFEENLEPLNIRRKAKDFFSFLESTFLPILTKLDQSFQNNSSIIFKLDETDLTVLSSDLKNFNKISNSINKVSREDPKSLIYFYKNHYLNYFSNYGIFEEEIYMPIYDMIQSPTLKQINYSKPIKKSKSPKLHIPLNLNKEQYYPANPLIKNKYILNIVEEADSSTSSPLKRRSSLLFKAKSAKNLVIKFNEKNQFSPIEEEKEKVRSRNTLIPRNNLRTQTISSEKFQKKNNYEERILTTPSNFAKKEKNTSFTNMDISRTLSRKDVKDSSEINAIRFINSIKRNKDNKFKINFLKTNEFDIKTLESPHNMDKSSLFLRNQMINLKKMEKLDPVEQMIWAIKHNHIHKVEELFLMYPSIIIDSRDEDGNSFLNIASQIGNFEIVSLFLLKGANFNIQNNNGDTALHLALSYYNDEIADKLIACGAQENIKNKDGKTPWDMFMKK